MSMKTYLQDAQMELFIFGIMSEFINNEGYQLSKEQQASVIAKNLNTLKTLGYDQTVVTDSESLAELRETVQKLAVFSMQLFSLCVMHSAREEKFREIIDSLKDKNL